MFIHSHINGCNVSQVGATMGITYDTDVANWDVPGTEWYVPKPADISCDAVDSYIALLTDYIGQWNKRLSDAQRALIKNRNKIANAQFMVNHLNQRLGEYQVRKDVCENPPPPPPVTVEPGVTEGDGSGSGGSGGSSGLLLVAAAAVAVYAFKRTKIKRRRKK